MQELPSLTPTADEKYFRAFDAQTPEGETVHFSQGKGKNESKDMELGPWTKMRFDDLGRHKHVFTRMIGADAETHEFLMSLLAQHAYIMRGLLESWSEVDIRVALDGFPKVEWDGPSSRMLPSSGDLEVFVHLKSNEDRCAAKQLAEEIRAAMHEYLSSADSAHAEEKGVCAA